MKKSQTLLGFMMMFGFGYVFLSKTGREPVLCITNCDTGDTYVKAPVNKGDVLSFGHAGREEEDDRAQCCCVGKKNQLLVGTDLEERGEYIWYNGIGRRQEIRLNGRVLALPGDLPEGAVLKMAVERRASYE